MFLGVVFLPLLFKRGGLQRLAGASQKTEARIKETCKMRNVEKIRIGRGNESDINHGYQNKTSLLMTNPVAMKSRQAPR